MDEFFGKNRANCTIKEAVLLDKMAIFELKKQCKTGDLCKEFSVGRYGHGFRSFRSDGRRTVFCLRLAEIAVVRVRWVHVT